MAGDAQSLRVAVFNADNGGCLRGFYRLLFPAAVLADQGHDVIVGPSLEAVRDDNPIYGDILVDVPLDADVAVFQRPCKRELVEAIPALQRRGVAVVVEIDDDLHAMPKGHPARRDFAPRNYPDRNWRWLAQACDLADLVTCTTPALASRYASHGRVVVLPNCVPERYLTVERAPHDGVVLSWWGTPLTHLGDLEVVEGAVADVIDATGCRFRAIGSAHTLTILGVGGEVIEWCELTDPGPTGYAATIASVDVAIVPLVASAFNAAKSALKMAEAAALGVPVIVSPSPDNLRMHAEGIGLMASTPDEWFRQLRRLVEDESLRVEVAERGRMAMAEWTYERRAGGWWDAWTQAAKNRQGARAA